MGEEKITKAFTAHANSHMHACILPLLAPKNSCIQSA